jgi:tetratricopeptide (TPR) repeat protein
MNTLTALSVTQANEETYNKLLVSLEAGLGMLQIFIAVCDDDRQREEIIANYERELASTAHNYRVYLDPQEPSLRLAISQQVTVRENGIATVTGTEGLSDRGESVEKFFGYLQWTREGLREFKMPIVLWIPARIFAQLAKQAPDFYSWRNGIFQFQPEPSFVTNELSENRGIEPTANDSSSSLFSVEQLESSLAQGIEQWGENSRNLEPLYSQLGSLYADRVESRESEDREREYALAQDYLHKAIALQTQFKQKESLSSSLYNLAYLYYYHREYEQAEPLYQQALELNRAGENQAEIAKVLNSLANLHKNKNEMSIAEPKYQEALQITRELAVENPRSFLPDVATTLNNLGLLHADRNEIAIAEQEYQEALQIRRELAVENPHFFLPNVATTLNNLANLHSDQNEMVIAEQEYQEALQIYQELAVKNPHSFLSDVAMILNNLANLHYAKNEMAIALSEYQKALQIRRELAVENPRSFLHGVATVLNNLAILHKNKNDIEIALVEYQEALKIRRELAVENPRSFLPDVAMTILNLSIFYLQAQSEKSLVLAQEVIEIAQQFPDLPSVQQYAEAARAVLQAISE